MTTILITGANKGLGHEAARTLIATGHDVWVAARDERRGRAAADELGARFVVLDVTDDAGVAAAAAHVEAEGGLDVLINNAGIIGPRTPVLETSAAELAEVYDTNVLGAVRVTRAFVPLLARSDNPVIVNVSSGLGSLAVTSDPERTESSIVALGYPSSKAALNMITTQYAKALPEMRVNVVDPGHTATDLNGHSGPQTVAEGVEAIVAMAQIDASGPTGTFTDRHGVLAW
ncbi:MAG TPA: SDR family NAD(P)-dependent oxidoreductase [Baekduia sp.]|jgi:NAD(P)-dependent dehydrogenase (short-subunit alcohol dehydrogenase family)